MKFEPQMSGVNEQTQDDEVRRERLLEATNVIPWEADAQTWVFTYVGPQAKTLLGYPPEQWYEKDFWVSHLHPEDRDSAIKFCETSSKSLTDFEFEYRMIAADGHTVWLNDVVNVVTKNGAPQVLRGFMKDITERKEVEAALRKSREKLIKAEQIARMGFLDWNLKTNQIVLSSEVYTLYGLTPGTLVDVEQIVAMTHPDDLENVRENLDMAIQGIRDYDIDHRIVRPDGNVLWVHARADVERDKDGIPISLMGTVVDITELRQANEDKTTLLHVVSKRLKELQCMYAISDSIRMRNSLDGIFQDAASAIPPGWHYPEITRAKLRCNGKEWVSKPFEETEWKQSSDIVVDGKCCGCVEVYYVEERPMLDEGPFFAQERNLIDNIARTLGEALQHKRAEELLKNSEARFRMMYEYAPVMIDAFDASGRCFMWNKECEKVFGWTAKEIFAHENPITLFYPDPIIQEQVVKTISRNPGTEFREWRPLRKDGSEAICLWANFRLPNGDIISLGQDITERKQAEEALQETRAQLDSYISTAPVGMAIFDSELRYSNVNETLAEINGVSIEDHLHKRPRDILPEPLGLAVEKRFRDILRTNQPIIHEEISGETLSQPGVTRHWLQSYFPILGAEQKPNGVGVTVIEISEIKRAEEQLRQSQKMEALGTLSGGIAHDFNNILYPIFIYANLLLEKFDADSEEYTDLKEITSAAQRAKDLVSQILMFSRRSDGVKHVCDLVPVINEAMKLMRAALPANITIEEKIPDGIVPVFCDSTQMYQVVVDICTNAGQAILGRGKVEIALDSSEVAGIVCFDGTKIHGNYCRLTVTDSGVGMDDETQAKIFDPFFTTREVGQGTGLGLSTVFGIVQDHEGGIKVSSEADKGTTFEVFLPLAEGPVETLPESRANVEDYAGTENILFVDDEKPIRNSVRSCLEGVGYNVTAVADGQEALDIFAKDLDRFDLVVTDLTMPNMTGEQLSQELMRLRPNTPVILCTGHGTAISREHSDAAGITAILHKPLAPTAILQAVRNVLDDANS
jgi:PAS domain S-box-containing protein